jgi:hypothetical protein
MDEYRILVGDGAISLEGLRLNREITTFEMAQALGVPEEEVIQLEQRSRRLDIGEEEAKRYVKALGGILTSTATFKDGSSTRL